LTASETACTAPRAPPYRLCPPRESGGVRVVGRDFKVSSRGTGTLVRTSDWICTVWWHLSTELIFQLVLPGRVRAATSQCGQEGGTGGGMVRRGSKAWRQGARLAVRVLLQLLELLPGQVLHLCLETNVKGLMECLAWICQWWDRHLKPKRWRRGKPFDAGVRKFHHSEWWLNGTRW
jgi:hypothetical protein